MAIGAKGDYVIGITRIHVSLFGGQAAFLDLELEREAIPDFDVRFCWLPALRTTPSQTPQRNLRSRLLRLCFQASFSLPWLLGSAFGKDGMTAFENLTQGSGFSFIPATVTGLK